MGIKISVISNKNRTFPVSVKLRSLEGEPVINARVVYPGDDFMKNPPKNDTDFITAVLREWDVTEEDGSPAQCCAQNIAAVFWNPADRFDFVRRFYTFWSGAEEKN